MTVQHQILARLNNHELTAAPSNSQLSMVADILLATFGRWTTTRKSGGAEGTIYWAPNNPGLKKYKLERVVFKLHNSVFSLDLSFANGESVTAKGRHWTGLRKDLTKQIASNMKRPPALLIKALDAALSKTGGAPNSSSSSPQGDVGYVATRLQEAMKAANLSNVSVKKEPQYIELLGADLDYSYRITVAKSKKGEIQISMSGESVDYEDLWQLSSGEVDITAPTGQEALQELRQDLAEDIKFAKLDTHNRGSMGYTFTAMIKALK